MHLREASQAFVLVTLALTSTLASGKPVENPETFKNMESGAWKDWVGSSLYRSPSEPPDSGTSKETSSHLSDPQRQNEGILSKYGQRVPSPDYKLPEARAWASLPDRDLTKKTGIEAQVKERKKIAQGNTWPGETGLGKGLGLPYNVDSRARAKSSPEISKSEDPVKKEWWRWIVRSRSEPKTPEEAAKKEKWWKRLKSNPKLFKSRRLAPIPEEKRGQKQGERAMSAPVDAAKEMEWSRHYSKARNDIASGRGDASLYHKHANAYVRVKPQLTRQSFHDERAGSSPEALRKQFKTHHRTSMTSDGRYSGDGLFFGKSPLGLGAEGARGRSMLTSGDADYRSGQYRHQLLQKATEEDDVRSTIMKPGSRLQEWRKAREGEDAGAQRAREEKGKKMQQTGEEGLSEIKES